MKTFAKSVSLSILLGLGIGSCSDATEEKSQAESPTKTTDSTTQVTPQKERPLAFENGKFFEKDGVHYLFGGDDESDHFIVTNLSLEPKQFHYGIGREDFPALIEPEFTTVESADKIWHDTTRFLLAYDGNDVAAYSVPDLINHEVVNDKLNGKPIMAAYCILADLGAIYSRQYGDNVLTFALSGYTYFDPEVWNGLDGFVLWDRETESLWWPLIGKAVSGDLKNAPLTEVSEENWKDTSWKYIKENFPQARVMVSGQDFERPTEWKRINIRI
jgi:hypothetical protein